MAARTSLRWLGITVLLVALVVGSAGVSELGRVGTEPPSPGEGPAWMGSHLAPTAPAPLASSGNDTWNELPAAPSLLDARSQVAMASDPALGGIVLFGGYNWTTSSPLDDTWLFSNGTWTDLGAYFLSVPPARWGATLVFDPADGYLVLFGGRDAGTTYADTWVLTATDARSYAGWTNLATTTAPSARAFAPAFYDPDSSSIILYGGGCATCSTSGGWNANNETWSFSAGRWTNATTSVGPSPGALMTGYAAWDPQLDGGLYFGGQDSSNNCTSPRTTWLYHGSWTQLTTNGTPSLAANGGMAWYAPETEMVVFGGLEQTAGDCAQDTHTTWSFQEYNWTDITTGSNASVLLGQRCCNGLAYDPFGQVVVQFGGDSQNETYYNQTWTYPALPFIVQASAGTRGFVNLTAISFAANASGGVGPYRFNWSFGDGTPNATTPNASHTYSAPGKYVAVVQVNDVAGRNTQLAFPVSIEPALSMNATSGALTGDAPFAVQFNATAHGGFAPYAWTWHFGDGFSWNGANVTHTFMIEGTFNVTVQVNDSFGENATAHFVAKVYGRLLATIVASTTAALAPDDVNFSAVLQGGASPFTYAWTFAPGVTGSGQQTDHYFASPGIYNVSLQVTDGLGYEATSSVTVSVYAHLSATAEVSHPVGLAPLTETFTALPVGGAPPLYYTWNFGDQTPTVPGETTSHQFLQAGNYTVQLTVHDSLGEWVNTTLSVEVVRPLAVAAATNATQGASPFPVTLTATTIGGLAPLEFLWTFGDGSTATGAVQTHAYAAGSYTAEVTVTDNAGENVSATVHLFAYPALGVTAAAEPAMVTLGNVTSLTATVTGGVPPTTLSWAGLPPGCLSRNAATIDCLPTTNGSFTVSVTAVDSVHENVSATLTLHVTEPNATACCGSNSAPMTVSDVDLAGIAVGILAVVGLAAVVLLVRRRRPPVAETAPDEGAAADDPAP